MPIVKRPHARCLPRPFLTKTKKQSNRNHGQCVTQLVGRNNYVYDAVIIPTAIAVRLYFKHTTSALLSAFQAGLATQDLYVPPRVLFQSKRGVVSQVGV